MHSSYLLSFCHPIPSCSLYYTSFHLFGITWKSKVRMWAYLIMIRNNFHSSQNSKKWKFLEKRNRKLTSCKKANRIGNKVWLKASKSGVKKYVCILGWIIFRVLNFSGKLYTGLEHFGYFSTQSTNPVPLTTSSHDVVPSDVRICVTWVSGPFTVSPS